MANHPRQGVQRGDHVTAQLHGSNRPVHGIYREPYNSTWCLVVVNGTPTVCLNATIKPFPANS